MPSFSKKSLAALESCHPDLQAVCRELIKQYDFSVLEGHRGKEAQEAAYAAGNSRLHYPASKHNRRPALAVDMVPYPVDWSNLARFREMLTRFDAVAHMLRQRGEISSEFVYGADWSGLKDWPHVEIK